MVTQICAIDNGYGDTKFKTQNYMSKFRSMVQVTSDDPIDNSIIEVEGIKYKIGTGTDDIDIRKTQKQLHKICTLAAIAQTMKDTSGEFKLVVGLPLMQFKNKEFREEFKKYIMKPECQEIKHDGIIKKVIIKDALVFAQGAAALYSDPSKVDEFKKNLVGVLDWGSLTVNGFVSEGMNPVPASMFTVNLGMTILYNRIKTAINTRLNYNVQDYEIPYLVNEPPKDMERIIVEVIDEHFEDIIKEMRKKNWSIETLNIFGVGGGFLVVKSIVRRYLQQLEVSKNPVYANVNGLYNVGRMIWQ